MIPLIWKETHETIKWMAIALLLITGYVTNFGFCLCDSFFYFVTFVGAVSGGILGLVQMSSESHGDRRALLLHRPLSWTRIFLAKVLAGATLYFMAMGLPLIYYIFNYFLADRVAPQLPWPTRWQLLFPWLAGIIGGFVYYLAGLFAAARVGRWYGSRCLGFGVALLGTFLIGSLQEFWQVVIALTILSLMVGMAAWGSFFTGGEDNSQPVLGKVGLTCTVFVGLIVIGVAGKKSIEAWFFAAKSRNSSSHLLITREGQVLNLKSRGSDSVCVDLEGCVVKEFRNQRTGQAIGRFLDNTAPTTPAHSEAWHGGGISYRANSRYIVPVSNSTKPLAESWAYIPSLGQLVGVEIDSRQLIGVIGPEGFTPYGQTSYSKFAGKLDYSHIRSNPDYLVFPSGVYAVDFRERQIRRLYEPQADEVVIGARALRDARRPADVNRDQKTIAGIESQQRSDDESPTEIVVGTTRAVMILNDQGTPQVVLPAAYDPWKFMTTLVRLENPTRYGVWYTPTYYQGLVPLQTAQSYLVEYSTAGDELSRIAIPTTRYVAPVPHRAWYGLATSPAEFIVVLGCLWDFLFLQTPAHGPFSTPFQLALANTVLDVMPDPIELQKGLQNSEVFTFIICIGLNSLAGGIGCYLAAKRLAFTGIQRVCWIACGLLFGFVGYLAMIATHEWPASVACSSCGQPMLVTHDSCRQCHAQQVAPPTDGTEIFATAEL